MHGPYEGWNLEWDSKSWTPSCDTLDSISKAGGGLMNMRKKNMRRISILVTAQTAYNLEHLAAMCGYREIGRVVDKLTREKMLSLRGGGMRGD